MKKVLFALMLVVMGNTFTAPKAQKNKNMEITASRISESEKKEIENAIQNEVQPFVNFAMSSGISEVKKQFSKETDAELFEKDYVISNSLKKEIKEKYIDEIVKFTLKGIRPRVVIKKVNYISQNEAEVNYDIKVKSLGEFWNIIELDDETERKIMKKMGIKDENQLERVMRSKGNDELKKKYYYVMLDEMVNFVNEEIKKTKEEEIWIDDMSVTVKKINGKWQVQDTNN